MAELKDILQDIINHTHSLGTLPLLKVTSDPDTVIEAISPDRKVVLTAKFKEPIPDFSDTIGMSQLDKLSFHLKNPEYKDNAKIAVVKTTRNGITFPDNITFENESGDFRNEYRFMNATIINEKMKSVAFRGVKWDIEFSPAPESIKRLKLQSNATEEKTFQVKTENDNLVVLFGNASTHAGSFVFHQGISGKLKHTWSWYFDPVLSILNLDGEKTIYISDSSALRIDVESEYAVYEYIMPAASNQ